MKNHFISMEVFLYLLKFFKRKKFLNRKSTFFRMNKSHSIDVNDIFDKRFQTFI